MAIKPSVVYVASLPHSGSTLLDLILGSTEKSFSLGEVWAWDKFVNIDDEGESGYNDYTKCSCGKKMRDCEFWGGVTNDFQNQFNSGYGANRKVQNELKSFFWGRKRLHQVDFGDTNYLDFIKASWNFVRDQNPDVQYLIDSSKQATSLARLAESGEVNLKVIHLVRNCAGVYNSHKKLKVHSGVLSFISFFIKQNLLIQKIIKVDKLDAILVSYENLAANPRDELDRIGKWLDLEFGDYTSAINQTEYHNIGGNQMRMKKFAGISSDNKWKKTLSVIEKMTIGLLAFPFHVKWKNL